MSDEAADLGSIPPEALEGMQPGKISLMDVFRGFKANLLADYETLSSEAYAARVREEGLGVISQSLNDGNLVLVMVCFFSTALLMFFVQEAMFGSRDDAVQDEEDEQVDPPRDFTIEQLREFDGIKNEKVYIAMCGEVFDVSSAKDFYGVDGTYHCFAGRDASRAMAKLSFDEEELSNQNLDDLGIFERDMLQSWIDKFKYGRNYPIVGRVSFPNVGESKRVFTVSELATYKGVGPPSDSATAASSDDDIKEPTQAAGGSKSVPKDSQAASVQPAGTVQALLPGRVSREILLCVRGKVFDVSYGGVEMYGPGGPYHIFAGIDASRALAKMSFDEEHVSSRELSDLSESEVKVLDDWERKFLESKKYPVVGVMEDADEAASAAVYVIPENMQRGKAKQ